MGFNVYGQYVPDTFPTDPSGNYIIPEWMKQFVPADWTQLPRVTTPYPVYTPDQVTNINAQMSPQGDFPQYSVPNPDYPLSPMGEPTGPPLSVYPLDPSRDVQGNLLNPQAGFTQGNVLTFDGKQFGQVPTGDQGNPWQIYSYPMGMTPTQIDALLAKSGHPGGSVFDPTDPAQLVPLISSTLEGQSEGTFGGTLAGLGHLGGAPTELGSMLGTAIGSATGNPEAKQALGAAGGFGAGAATGSFLSGLSAPATTLAAADTAANAGANIPFLSTPEGIVASEVNAAGQPIGSLNASDLISKVTSGSLDAFPSTFAPSASHVDASGNPVGQSGAIQEAKGTGIVQGTLDALQAQGQDVGPGFDPSTMSTIDPSLQGALGQGIVAGTQGVVGDAGALGSFNVPGLGDSLKALTLANMLAGLFSPQIAGRLSMPGSIQMGASGGGPSAGGGGPSAGQGAGGGSPISSATGSSTLTPSQLAALSAMASQTHPGLAPPFEQRMKGLPETPGLQPGFTVG